jgi:DNA sulfur modification protein DndD
MKKLDNEIGTNKEIGPFIRDTNEKRGTAYESSLQYEKKMNDAVTDRNSKKSILDMKRKKLAGSLHDKEVEKAKNTFEFAGRIKSALDLAVERLTKSRIDTVAKHSSEIFRKLTNNPELYVGLELDESFEVKVKHYDGVVIPTYRYSPSAGASQVIATSLIAGLSKYTTREAPIVIDTPLGRLDTIHKENLIGLYPSLNSQVIVIYQPEELSQKDIDLLRDNIASEWIIEEDPHNPDLSRIRMERKSN